jgi:hypothetical protein
VPKRLPVGTSACRHGHVRGVPLRNVKVKENHLNVKKYSIIFEEVNSGGERWISGYCWKK